MVHGKEFLEYRLVREHVEGMIAEREVERQLARMARSQAREAGVRGLGRRLAAARSYARALRDRVFAPARQLSVR